MIPKQTQFTLLFYFLFPCVGNTEVVTKVNGTAAAEAVPSPNLHDLQVYGVVVTIILCFIVFGGVKMINRVAPAFLVPVLFSVFCIFVGALLTGKDDPTGEFSLFCIFIFFISFYFYFSCIKSIPQFPGENILVD